MENYIIDPNIAYDVVVLPSYGIHYANKKKSVRVAYLTAADEDILSAKNLVKSKSVVDELLKRKILDKDLPIEEIVEEDVQAILIFLRNTAWGSEYKVYVTDPETNQQVGYPIDLSSIKMKDFDLVADGNGEYEYYLEKSKVNITFKFLTKPQETEIEKIAESWNGIGAPPVKTKELEMMIKSVGGVRDPMLIRSFIVDKMPIKDAQDFRKYVEEKKPGLILTKKIQTPTGEIDVNIGFGVEFFRPFYGI